MISNTNVLSPGSSDSLAPMTTSAPPKDHSLGSSNGKFLPKQQTKAESCVTEKPFVRNRQIMKQKKLNPTLIHFDSLFGNNNWSKFLVLRTEENITPPKLEYHLLKRCPTKEMAFRSLKEKEWLIETSTIQQSENLMSMTHIEGIKVSITRHANMNSIKGTVILPKYEDDKELVDPKMLLDCLQMRYDNVEDLEVYNIPSRKNPKSPLNIAKIKFKGQNLPPKVIIFGQNREVRPYIPTPLQCKNCSKYGHSTKKCYNDPICAFCGSSNHETKWNCGKPKCTNCGKAHHARSKECPFYMYNTELKILQDRTGMAIREAKLELRARGFKDPTKDPSYLTVTQQTSKTNLTQNAEGNKATTNTRLNKNNEMSTEDNISNLNDPMKVTITNPNQFSVLADMEEEDIEEEEEEIWENAQEDIKEPLQDINLESKDRKRSLDRTPPRSKKLITEDSVCNPSVKLTGRNNIEKPNLETIEKLDDIRNKDQTSQEIDNPLMEKERMQCDTKQYGENMSISNSNLSKGQLNFQVTKVDVHHNQSDNQTSTDSSEKDISPSPIIGATGKLIEKTKSEKRAAHKISCGCNECFLREIGEISNLTTAKANNLIDNFIKNKINGNDSELHTHHAGCLCVDHLIKKRATSNFSLEKFIAKFKKDNTETFSKETKSKQKISTASRQLSNSSKISRNNILQIKDTTPAM